VRPSIPVIVTIVGSGTLVPSAVRSTPCIALQSGDFQATLDGGTGSLRRQAELGIDFRRTDTLFFTHIHPDHTLDVLHFLFASKYTPDHTRREPVRLVGPRGFGAYVEALRQGVRSWTDGGEPGLVVEELEDGGLLRAGPLRVEAVELHHPVINLGYRISDTEGRTAAFTGDTEWGDGLLRLARGADLLVVDCSGDSEHPKPGHLTAPEVGRAAASAAVGQVVLTHLYPLADDSVRVREVAAHYRGPVLLASDGDRFEL
jgi:ribonuclease BN (tRNA processing enzyme)